MSRLNRHQIFSLTQSDANLSRAVGIHKLNVARAKKDILNPSLLEKAHLSQNIMFQERAKRQEFIQKQKRTRVF